MIGSELILIVLSIILVVLHWAPQRTDTWDILVVKGSPVPLTGIFEKHYSGQFLPPSSPNLQENLQ